MSPSDMLENKNEMTMVFIAWLNDHKPFASVITINQVAPIKIIDATSALFLYMTTAQLASTDENKEVIAQQWVDSEGLHCCQ